MLERTIIRATCDRGLAPWLEREVAALGYAVAGTDETGVEIEGGMRDAMRLCLHLRTAHNVLVQFAEFHCDGPEDLYDGLRALAWEEVLDPAERLCVVSRVDHPSIRNWNIANLKAKDAIVDRVAARAGRRPDSGPERAGAVVVNVYWKDRLCRVYLNASGEKLADRGYRRRPHTAPMRETLAAGALIAAGYDGAAPLVNPMCGSGTLAIEAALIALRRAPGSLRGGFGFMRLKRFDGRHWRDLCGEARASEIAAPPAPIVASDIDPKAVETARKNAAAAGVERFITFHVCDFAETPLPSRGTRTDTDTHGPINPAPSPALIILNPEYGERLGRAAELETTYARIGDFFKQRGQGWTGCVFTGNLALARKIGLHPRRRVPFFNAAIECRLLEYELYPGSRKPGSQTSPAPPESR